MGGHDLAIARAACVLRFHHPRAVAVGRRKLPRHLTWLEAFVAAVEAGSLEAAAKHLGLVRSVVSEHLRALEDAVTPGHALLERGPGRRLRLTAQGERLYAATNAPLHA